MKKILCLAAAALFFAVFAAPSEAAGDWPDGYPDAGICVGNSVRLREDPDTESEIVGRVNEGDWLVLLGETSVEGQKWYAVDHPTQEGTAWIFGRYVETYRGREAGTPAYNASLQALMDFGVTPEKARVLLGNPLKAAKEPAGETLEYPNCKLQYVKGRLRHVELWERGRALGGLQVGDPASRLIDVLGEPASEGSEGWSYGAAPRMNLLFEIGEGKVTRITWDGSLGG